MLIFAMLVRTLISEGRIVTRQRSKTQILRRVGASAHRMKVNSAHHHNDGDHPENETRMRRRIHEDRDQIKAVMAGRHRAAGSVAASTDLSIWHDL
jgi:hypothetical protein